MDTQKPAFIFIKYTIMFITIRMRIKYNGQRVNCVICLVNFNFLFIFFSIFSQPDRFFCISDKQLLPSSYFKITNKPMLLYQICHYFSTCIYLKKHCGQYFCNENHTSDICTVLCIQRVKKPPSDGWRYILD